MKYISKGKPKYSVFFISIHKSQNLLTHCLADREITGTTERTELPSYV